MGISNPKQYLSLRGKTILEHTLSRIMDHPLIEATVLVISSDDAQWPHLASYIKNESLMLATGGAERCHSVLNGLRSLTPYAEPQDWVLVHDAARPCVRRDDIDRLIGQLQDHPVGGLLGIPVSDTIKRSDELGNITETVKRDGLWRALTPQMFRFELLLQALQKVCDMGKLVTDEAAAIESAGYSPRLIEGHEDNIKITRQQDLALAELFLQQQERP